jgi:hypothetical protein
VSRSLQDENRLGYGVPPWGCGVVPAVWADVWYVRLDLLGRIADFQAMVVIAALVSRLTS